MIKVITLVSVLLVLTGGYAVYKHQQVLLQRTVAADIFYIMRPLGLELANVIKETEVRRTSASNPPIWVGIANEMWRFIPATAFNYGLKTDPLKNKPTPDS